MAKFHINKHGVPAPCKAKSGNCPLGGDESHFSSQEKAQAYIDKRNEQEHGLLPGMNNNKVEINSKHIETKYSAYRLTSMLVKFSDEAEDKKADIWKDKRFDIRDYIVEYKSIYDVELNPEKVKKALREKRINITDFDETTEQEKKALLATSEGITGRKVGNILGFLNSDNNTSYSRTKAYSKDNFEGNFDDVYYKLTILSDVGWHKNSVLAINDENTSLNAIMDKKSVEMASEILRTSEANQESETYPASGLVSSIQALRLRGMSEVEIMEKAKKERLDEVVYREYKVKPRPVSGATEMIRVMLKEANEESDDLPRNIVSKVLGKKLGWTE